MGLGLVGSRSVTPLGHAAVAYASSALQWRPAIALRSRTVVAALVVGGVVPDIDFALFWHPGFNEFHRIVTHNLAFVAVAAAVGWALAKWRGWDAASVAAGLVVGGLLHLLVDSVMDGNPSNGVGVALLWPFSDRTFSPFNIIPISSDPPSWRELHRMIPAVLYGVMFELPFYVAALALYFRRRRELTGPRS
jgi:membrane-bound metal-dependent hydrolase YbcI (DUF457 family)